MLWPQPGYSPRGKPCPEARVILGRATGEAAQYGTSRRRFRYAIPDIEARCETFCDPARNVRSWGQSDEIGTILDMKLRMSGSGGKADTKEGLR